MLFFGYNMISTTQFRLWSFFPYALQILFVFVISSFSKIQISVYIFFYLNFCYITITDSEEFYFLYYQREKIYFRIQPPAQMFQFYIAFILELLHKKLIAFLMQIMPWV